MSLSSLPPSPSFDQQPLLSSKEAGENNRAKFAKSDTCSATAERVLRPSLAGEKALFPFLASPPAPFPATSSGRFRTSSKTCMYPIGDPRDVDFVFCGARVWKEGKTSYCFAHHSICYRSRKNKVPPALLRPVSRLSKEVSPRSKTTLNEARLRQELPSSQKPQMERWSKPASLSSSADEKFRSRISFRLKVLEPLLDLSEKITVAQQAREHGVSVNTIYSWLRIYKKSNGNISSLGGFSYRHRKVHNMREDVFSLLTETIAKHWTKDNRHGVIKRIAQDFEERCRERSLKPPCHKTIKRHFHLWKRRNNRESFVWDEGTQYRLRDRWLLGESVKQIALRLGCAEGEVLSRAKGMGLPNAQRMPSKYS